MQTISFFFLFVFTAFIVTPTAVTMIKKNADVSVVFNIVEEEQTHSERKLLENHTKIIPNFFTITFILPELISSNPFSAYYVDWSNINSDTFSPPPERLV